MRPAQQGLPFIPSSYVVRIDTFILLHMTGPIFLWKSSANYVLSYNYLSIIPHPSRRISQAYDPRQRKPTPLFLSESLLHSLDTSCEYQLLLTQRTVNNRKRPKSRNLQQEKHLLMRFFKGSCPLMSVLRLSYLLSSLHFFSQYSVPSSNTRLLHALHTE